MKMTSKYFALAAETAIKKTSFRRASLHGSVGIRGDGTIVKAKNLPRENKDPKTHAEALLCRKLDSNAVVFVVRLNRDGDYIYSRPCVFCQIAMRQKFVKKCYYTINQTEYGVITF